MYVISPTSFGKYLGFTWIWFSCQLETCIVAANKGDPNSFSAGLIKFLSACEIIILILITLFEKWIKIYLSTFRNICEEESLINCFVIIIRSCVWK